MEIEAEKLALSLGSSIWSILESWLLYGTASQTNKTLKKQTPLKFKQKRTLKGSVPLRSNNLLEQLTELRTAYDYSVKKQNSTK